MQLQIYIAAWIHVAVIFTFESVNIGYRDQEFKIKDTPNNISELWYLLDWGGLLVFN